MNLKTAVSTGKQNGWKTVSECIRMVEVNIEQHTNLENIDSIISSLMIEVEALSDVYDDDVLNWTIKEYETYE